MERLVCKLEEKTTALSALSASLDILQVKESHKRPLRPDPDPPPLPKKVLIGKALKNIHNIIFAYSCVSSPLIK